MDDRGCLGRSLCTYLAPGTEVPRRTANVGAIDLSHRLGMGTVPLIQCLARFGQAAHQALFKTAVTFGTAVGIAIGTPLPARHRAWLWSRLVVDIFHALVWLYVVPKG